VVLRHLHFGTSRPSGGVHPISFFKPMSRWRRPLWHRILEFHLRAGLRPMRHSPARRPSSKTIFLHICRCGRLAGMTEPSPDRPPRRSHAEYRWTRPKIHAFLKALSLEGSVAAAARRVGMSRHSAYRLRARLGSSFGEIWTEALAIARTRRAMQGDRSPSQGDRSGTQGDTLQAQGDRSALRGDTFPAQGDTFRPGRAVFHQDSVNLSTSRR